VKASQVLPDEIKKYGGVPIMWKAGHSLMKRKMREEGALLGGEVSGHIFIGEGYHGFDDAPLVALKALEILSKSEKPLSDILNEMPTMLATPEIILSAPDEVKFKIIDAVSEKLHANYEVVTVDGARAVFENGWGLVRASNTQPAITLRFEAHTANQMVEYLNRFNDLLKIYPEVDRAKLETQINTFQKLSETKTL
jgi:phosphomannomutase / phosphoglucomutase